MDSKPASTFPLDILIVGGGLCGLATAISVTLAGHHATVFETTDVVHEFGAGLQTSPNGTRLYRRWGLDHLLQLDATTPSTLQISAHDGKLLARRTNYDDEIYRRYSLPLWTLHRVDLQAALLTRAQELGVEIRYSSRVVDIDLVKSRILLKNGQNHVGDLVVVADGVRSTMREHVLKGLVEPGLTNPAPTGDMAYRITIDRDDVTDSELSTWLQEPRIQLWLGPGSHAVGYTVRRGSKLNVVLLVPDDMSADKARENGSVEEMKELFKGWDPILTKMLESVKTVEKWKLMHLLPLPRWRSSEGFCVMAGDCCHAILPYMAQGLNLGLEDAAVLGCLLGHVQSREQIPEATALYEEVRRSRTSRMLRETLIVAQEHHAEDGEIVKRRNERLARSFDHDSDWMHPQQQKWIWSYDAYEEAEAAYKANPF